MANIQSSKKRARQAVARNLHNSSLRSAYRTSIKAVKKAIEAGNVELAQTSLSKAFSLLDKVARKKIIHKNKAARHKSRLNAKVKAMQS